LVQSFSSIVLGEEVVVKGGHGSAQVEKLNRSIGVIWLSEAKLLLMVNKLVWISMNWFQNHIGSKPALKQFRQHFN